MGIAQAKLEETAHDEAIRRDFEQQIQFKVVGAERPTWRDVLAVRLVLWPYAAWRRRQRSPDEVQRDKAARLGMTVDEYRAELARQAAKLKRKMARQK